MPGSVTPSRRCLGSAASLSSSAARLAACSSVGRTSGDTGFAAGTTAPLSARPPSSDESLGSLLSQHPMSTRSRRRFWARRRSSGCCSAKKQAARNNADQGVI
eukprot:scaffold70626_cov41-Phaeocystis_antarctica.AAC.3